MKKLVCFCLFFSITPGVFSQYWMRSFGGSTIDEGLDIVHGTDDETYSTGYFSGSAVFDAQTLSTTGLSDIFLVKTDSNGLIPWIKQAGGSGINKGLAVDAHASGSIVITGFFSNTAQFDSQSIVSAGQQDVFIAKYTASGNLLWVISAGGTGSDIGNCVKFDNAGNIIVTGEFSGACNFGGTVLSSLSGSIDVFTAKYDPNGNLIWVKKGSGLYTDRGIKLSVDANGDIYVNGLFSDTITFDVTYNTTISNAKFLIKYDQAGNEKWFRWIGGSGQSEVGGMETFNSNLTMTGSFIGNLYFFGSGPVQTLNGTGNYNLYLCRYDTSGNLMWINSTGSANEIKSHDVTLTVNDEIIVAGNFSCRLTAFSGIYGDGTFCSAGFSDCFAAGYDSNGNWQWAHHFGSTKNDYANSISSGSGTHLSIAGSAEKYLYSTLNPSTFSGYNTIPIIGPGSYCGDPDYFKFVKLISDTNSSDIFINSNINLARQPLDFFDRTGGGCLRPFGTIDICSITGLCSDTLSACGIVNVKVNLNSIDTVPEFHYLWSDGQTTRTAVFNSSGIVSVMLTSFDGCFIMTDSVYILIHPIPPVPLISDSKGINFFSLNANPVPLCLPDSVVLFSPNSGTYTVQWQGFPTGVNPVTVNNSGPYYCVFSDSFGCSSSNIIQVIGANAFPLLAPQLICLEDQDKNDTIIACDSSLIRMFIYDTISNPSASINCITGLSTISWIYSINGIPFSYQGGCNPTSIYTITASPPGNYDFIFSAWVIRINVCDTDSVYIFNKHLHVIVNPSPSGGTLNTIISGPLEICPGDTALLLATGGTSFTWNNNSTNSSISVTAPGFYAVNSDSVVTNSFGCSASYYGYANFTLNMAQQPIISPNPPGALLCINDSLQLICSSAVGSFQWQGPTGILPDTTNSIYIGIPGFYYCIQTISPTCQLISNTLQITQVNTPSFGVLPSNTLCKGDSVEIIIYADPGTLINWDPPLFGYEFHQTVFDSGTYVCQVLSCNTYYTFNITVLLDSGLAVISSADSSLTICNGDSIELTANPGMIAYEWNPSGAATPSVYTSVQGSVSLLTTNSNGCKDSAMVFINVQPNNLTPPSASDTSLCAGDSVLLFAQSSTPVYWTSLPSYQPVIFQGSAYQTSSLSNPVTYYLYTDSGKCKSELDSVHISISAPAIATISSTDTMFSFCEGESITLIANPGMTSYLWLPGNEQTTTILVDTTKTISLITETLSGCRDSTGVHVFEQLNNLEVPYATDTTLCEGLEVELTATGNNHINWSLSMNYTTVIQTGNTFLTPILNQSVTYYLFSDSGFCKSAFDSVSVFISPCPENPDTTSPFIPNIFTPNGDGINDFFPGFENHQINYLKIYNRWGEELFIGRNIFYGWDGLNKSNMQVPDGIYFYFIEFVKKNTQYTFRKGYFMLIR